MEYKLSHFDYIVKKKDGVLIYNTLYSSLTRLSDEELFYINDLRNCPEELLKGLLDQGIVIEASIDEVVLYNKYVKLAAKYYTAKPNITVTPTMECNARCFYCYEENVRHGKMKDEAIPRIIDVIKSLDIGKGINLTWFGGEPLLNQDWMDHFSDELRKENIFFTSFIISNGSKINQNVIEKMKNNWNITSIQITFDGSNDEYYKRKNYVDQDNNTVYYEMLQRIKLLAKNGIAVQIRLNIDKQNMDSIIEAARDIQYLFSDNENVSYYPAFLTGSNEKLSEEEKLDVVRKLIDADKSNIMSINSHLYRPPKVGACFYNQKGAISIDTDGNIFICDRKLGHAEYAVGNIYINSALENDERVLAGQRKECNNCVFLPKCMGGCNDAYENNEVPCFIDKYLIKAYLDLL